MTFTYTTAQHIIRHYRHLIGRPFVSGIGEIEIINLVIAPVDEQQCSVFMAQLENSMDYEKALNVSGYDPQKVIIIIMGSHINAPDIRVNQNFDHYLRKNHIERVYLNLYYFEP